MTLDNTPSIDVIRHWVAWGSDCDCEQEHSTERIAQFERFLYAERNRVWNMMAKIERDKERNRIIALLKKIACDCGDSDCVFSAEALSGLIKEENVSRET